MGDINMILGRADDEEESRANAFVFLFWDYVWHDLCSSACTQDRYHSWMMRCFFSSLLCALFSLTWAFLFCLLN